MATVDESTVIPAEAGTHQARTSEAMGPGLRRDDSVAGSAAAPQAPAPRARRERPPPIQVTPAAAARIADLIARAPEAAAGVRLTTPKRGCSGLAYSLAYVTAPQPGDEAVATPGGTLFIDGGSLMYLIGSTMDWAEDDFTAGFVFTNPNAKGQCGCGESFTV